MVISEILWKDQEGGCSGKSRRGHDRQLSGDRDKRSKGQLKGAEESENFRIAVQRGNVTQVKRILENGRQVIIRIENGSN